MEKKMPEVQRELRYTYNTPKGPVVGLLAAIEAVWSEEARRQVKDILQARLGDFLDVKRVAVAHQRIEDAVCAPGATLEDVIRAAEAA